ncbi:hypothetical protein [Occultella kanbiaonis]|uniref:hypothetical protein n=1 Tax=Occultella kanbiaonis TaxID=2675754 RepID=UPI0012B71D88|nr:hypothetical protein [Occultella kanbiaonis]
MKDTISDRIAATLAAIPLELERVKSELATGLQAFAGNTALQGARVLPVGPTGRPLAWAGPGRLVGWSVRAGEAAAALTLRDSRQAGEGDVVAVLDVPAGESATVWLGPGGVSITEGLYVETAGDVTAGAVWLGAVD